MVHFYSGDNAKSYVNLSRSTTELIEPDADVQNESSEPTTTKQPSRMFGCKNEMFLIKIITGILVFGIVVLSYLAYLERKDIESLKLAITAESKAVKSGGINGSYKCELRYGYGRGGSHVEVDGYAMHLPMNNKCFSACLNLKKIEPTINGITVDTKDPSKCLCEKNMTSITNRYKTCFLTANSTQALKAHPITHSLIGTAQSIQSDKLIKQLDTLGKEFNITFDFYARKQVGWGHILHFMTGNTTPFQYGDRIPDIYYTSSMSTLRVYFDLDNKERQKEDISNVTVNEWHRLDIIQYRKVDSYVHKIWLDGKLKYLTINTGPREFKNVRVYATETTLSTREWKQRYPPQAGQIRNLKVISGNMQADINETYSCNFTHGDGIGGPEFKVGNFEGDECVRACLHMKKLNPEVNGVTMFINTTRRGCWCEKAMEKTRPSKTFKTCFLMTNNTKMIERNPVNTIVGSVYVQVGTTGVASYHFNSVDDCYISYTNSNWKLDSGKDFPAKKQFINVTIDEKKRTFHGEITWKPDSIRGCVIWSYQMNFSRNMYRIESGESTCYDKDGKTIDKHLYGVDLKYHRWQEGLGAKACNFTLGDGVGGIEIGMGSRKGNASCVDACLHYKALDPTINGVTMRADPRYKYCWCERNMQSIGGRHKACFLEKVVLPSPS